MKTSTSKKVILHGFIVNEEGEQSLDKKYIALENGKIKQVSTEKPAIFGSAITLELPDSNVVFPGFLDLHTHIEYNMIPNWDSEKSPWDNRHEWRNDIDYHNDIAEVHSYIIEKWGSDYSKSVDDFRILGEIQAISGGTTVLQETEAYNDETQDPTVTQSNHLLIRSTGRGEDLGLNKDQLIFSVIDFYKPEPKPSGNSHISTADWTPTQQEKLLFFEKEMPTDFINTTLVHLAEGRAGFLKENYDIYSRTEFECFMSDMKNYAPEEVRTHNISIIHGCGIDSKNPDHIKFLKDYGISILWAPISNTLLYSDTINVFDFITQGVNVALGSDWSPSGGKHVWDEAKFAYEFCSSMDHTLTDAELKSTIYKMITSNAVKCLGNSVKLSKIEKDYPADFIVFNRRTQDTSALDALFTGDDTAVSCVVVNGRIIYGNKNIFDSLMLDFKTPMVVDYQPLPASDGPFAARKFISVNSELNFDVSHSTTKLDNLLNKKPCPRQWKRSKYLSADDTEYLQRIDKLKRDLRIQMEGVGVRRQL